MLAEITQGNSYEDGATSKLKCCQHQKSAGDSS